MNKTVIQKKKTKTKYTDKNDQIQVKNKLRKTIDKWKKKIMKKVVKNLQNRITKK